MFCPDCGTWSRADAALCGRCAAPLPLVAATAERPDEEVRLLRAATGNRYRVRRRLGSGGMAHVYLAEHAHLGRPVVLKVLHPHLARDREMAERFRREAEAASRLVHPHICPILDFGFGDEVVYLVMPYLGGGSIADRLSRTRTLHAVEASAIAAQVASALDHAHRNGIVHRDVKPDNVLFDEDGHASVTDFGIATARFHGRLTDTGRVMGTPHYMSPEQAMGRIVDGRSDVYALGILLYEMLVGFPPFDGADAFSVGYKQVHETPVSLAEIDATIPITLVDVVMRCLAKKPAERPATGAILADELVALMSSLDFSDAGARRRVSTLARSTIRR